MTTTTEDESAAEILDDVYFRNGFVIAEAGREIEMRPGWGDMSLGGLRMISHPETQVAVAATDDRHVAVIGLAFDPERGLYDHDVILEQLLGDSRNEEVFLETLDRLAGRFAVVVHTPARTEIYQDAMGSRSVFYSTAGPAVAASHAELVREAIGTHFADFFIPFITSRNYLQRDVKYLPGVATPYEKVLQLTPNTKLVMPEQRTERFWPREPIGGALENGAAVDSLIHHLEGTAAFVTYQKRRPVMGLTAGSDSRGMFAALKDLDPYVFTYVRSENGTAVNSKDARAAREAGELHGLQTNVWPIQNRLGLNAVDDSFSHAYRLATAYYRGAGSAWLSRLAELRSDIPTGIFIRGFGGEIMRGFYQLLSKRIVHVSVGQLSNAYDVNAGSKITRRFFADMMERTQFTDAHLQGYDPNDIFYWEHRMGTWGSVSLTEADLAMTSMVGYNSRNLYMTFMRLSGADRASRVAFQRATSALAPKLADAIS